MEGRAWEVDGGEGIALRLYFVFVCLGGKRSEFRR